MSHVQRDTWNGPPERLSDAFRLTKPKGDGAMTAVCEDWSHPFGWELRLTVDGHGLMMTSVVRSAGEMLSTSDQWRAAMIEKSGADRTVGSPRGPVIQARAPGADFHNDEYNPSGRGPATHHADV
jgi:hypothetical protein